MTTVAVGTAQVRGFALTAFADFDFTDVIAAASGVGFELFNLPLASSIVGGRMSVVEVFDSATSDAIEIGDATSAARYLATSDADAAIADFELLGNLLGYKIVAADRAILAEWTAVGAVPTQGIAEVLAVYADPNYATINQER